MWLKRVLVLHLLLHAQAEFHGSKTKSSSAEYYRASGKPWTWPESGIMNKDSFIFHLLKHKLKIQVIEKIPTTLAPPDCICVPYYQCDSKNNIISDGVGIIDFRIRRCTGDLEVCCKIPLSTSQPPTMQPTMPSTMSPTVPSTLPPTMSPTMPPTMSSTMPPTMSPTMPPTSSSPITQFPTVPSNCVCVPASQCDANGVVIVSGAGIINPRQTLNPCALPDQVCCRLPTTEINFPTYPITIPSTAPSQLITVSPTQFMNCVCVLISQCDVNGFVIVSGAGNIDPRFPDGRQGQIVSNCAVGQICCKIPSNGQDSSIGFPVTTALASPTASGPMIDPRANGSSIVKNAGTSKECLCVQTGNCRDGFVITSIGEGSALAGAIDSRFGPCMSADAICCRPAGVISNVIQSVVPPVTFVINQNAYPNNQLAGLCGIRGASCIPGQTCSTTFGETNFSEFPWMVALLIRQPRGNAIFRCGASMLNTRAVLTAAHCVLNRQPGVLVARLGEWNTANNNEPSPFQEADVESIVTHPQYYGAGLYNDIAVLILATPVSYTVNVQSICLPPQSMLFPPGSQCVATGWGRNGFEGKYQTILRKVELPLVERNECQARLRATKLGPYFQLHSTFLCAGGELSKDTCTGDGGGPLVCPTATGQYVQTGIVSWGIGCGSSNVPAVYTDVAQHRQWIDQQLANHGVS